MNKPCSSLLQIIGVPLVMVTMIGCGRGQTPAAPAPAAAPSSAPVAATTGDGEEERARTARAAAEREAERARAVLEARVFFDYDRAELRPDARRALDEKAQALRAAPEVRLRIEGHADERGSTEYNLALGSRRASTVVDYLTGFGLSASRFDLVSLGEERPLVRGTGEEAWGQNRRAEFVVTSGSPRAQAGF
jgi:peptidoglycan-associated lipoprotein